MNRRRISFILSLAGASLVGVLSACGSNTNAAPTEGVSVESSPPATLESNFSPENSDDYVLSLGEIQERQAIAVAASGCLKGDTKRATSDVFFYPRLWRGTILSHGIDEGVLDYPKERDAFVLFMHDIHYSDYVTESFETASALDPTFQPLVEIWQKAGNRAIKRWNRGGVSAIEAVNPGPARRIEARCKVPVMQALALAKAVDLSLNDWVQEAASGLLPLAWEDKDFINTPDQ